MKIVVAVLTMFPQTKMPVTQINPVKWEIYQQLEAVHLIQLRYKMSVT